MAKIINKWDMFYPDEWEFDEVVNFAAFVYLIQFPNSNEYYIGVKQVFKGIKDYNLLRSTSIESNWETYYSSSKSVKEMIDAGEPYKKSILWCFKTVQEAMLVESTLIGVCGTDYRNLNKAIMVKTRLKKDNGEQRAVLQRLIGEPNIMDIRGGFNHGDGVIDATRWLNTQERTITLNVQSEITKRIRELTKKLQSDLEDAIAGGPVPFTKRAFFFNFIQNGPTRTNQIIIRGDQAAYLRSVVTDANELFNKIIPTSNAKLTKQGNITGLQKNMNKRYKVIERKGKKMLVDTTMKKKKRNKRIIGIVEEKRRKMVFDFFKEAEAGAKIALSGVNGTYIFTRQITQ